MGTHGAVGAKTRAVTAGNRANKSTDASAGGSRFLNLSNWPVSRRLFAVIVLALVMGLVFGGLRIASAETSASQFGRVSQLATLGQRLTVLIQDLQDERDQTLTYLASSEAEPLAPLLRADRLGGRGGPGCDRGDRQRLPGEHPERRRHGECRHHRSPPQEPA